MSYGLQPWDLERLRPDEWRAIHADHERRRRAAEEG